jgi:hypothetical protein
MEPNDIDHLEDTPELDVRRLKRMLEARAHATREFQRVKTAMLGYGAAALRSRSPSPPLPQGGGSN